MNEDITRKFTTTLQHDEAIVKGLRVDASKAVIVEVSSLPRNGAEFPTRVNAVAFRDKFRELVEKFDSSS